ncbi:MAG: C1 family peptidase, partial [Candidatus Woesearchaeota archaeon]
MVRVDLRQGFSRLRSQGNLKSCTAMAATAMLEYIRNRMNEWYDDRNKRYYSPRFIWFNNRMEAEYQKNIYGEHCVMHDTHPKDMNMGSDTAWTKEAIEKHGVCDDDDWEYKGCEARPTFSGQSDHFKNKFAFRPTDTCYSKARAVSDFLATIDIIGIEPAEWINEIMHENPIFISIYVPDSFRTPSDTRLYDLMDSFSTEEGHAVILAGYDSQFQVPDQPGKVTEAFLIRNSWGDNWGEEGNLWMSRKALEHIVKKVYHSRPMVFRARSEFKPFDAPKASRLPPPLPAPYPRPVPGPNPSSHGDFVYQWWLFDDTAQFSRASDSNMGPATILRHGLGRKLNGPTGDNNFGKPTGAKNQATAR